MLLRLFASFVLQIRMVTDPVNRLHGLGELLREALALPLASSLRESHHAFDGGFDLVRGRWDFTRRNFGVDRGEVVVGGFNFFAPTDFSPGGELLGLAGGG